MWQSDFIHWRLEDGTDVEILNWLDDHSRYLLSCTAHRPVTGDAIVAAFLDVVERYGPLASTLIDNGSVYTSRFTGGRNAFEYVLPLLGVRQKNGSPGHAQTQGKTERFHQTQQRWLRARPPARTIAGLQRQLDELRAHYNEQRPRRATSASAPNTPANASSHSPTSTTSPSPNSPPARSSQSISSTLRRPTGATNTESQAAGLAPRTETYDGRHLRPMSRDITSSG
ncbi:MAG TPA: integrase core domain-containing protein [Solirubrobacteraceae bacterium]